MIDEFHEEPTIDEIRERYGDWTAMSIHLGNGRYTKAPEGPDRRLRRFVQTVADLAGKPIESLRVLDLACLEGHYAVEFALQGASVVGIEGRQSNLQRALFAAHTLSLENVTFHLDDVRNLSAQRYGHFDVVLCAGIFYHLDAPDLFDFARRIHEVCDRMAVFETFVSLRPSETFEHEGHIYKGLYYVEHDPNASSQERSKNFWASLENSRSVWLTRPSLLNLLSHCGFTSIFECHAPTMVDVSADRHTFVAMRGKRVEILSSPLTEAHCNEDLPEDRCTRVHPIQHESGPLHRLAKSMLPSWLKDLLKPGLRALRLLPADTTPDWRKRQLRSRHRSGSARHD